MRPSRHQPSVQLDRSRASSVIRGGTSGFLIIAALAIQSPAEGCLNSEAGPQAPAKAPSAPSNLSSTAISSSEIRSSWADNSTNETGFKVERANSSSGPWVQVATVGAGVVSYSDTGLEAATLYFYRVRAYNSVGNSSYSNVASSTTQAGVITHNVAFDYSNLFTTNRTDSVLAIHPLNPGILYRGTWGGGVLKSTDGGRSWASRNKGLPSLFIGDIKFDPANPSVMYVAIVGHIFSNGGTIYKSTNGGDYWEPLAGALGGGIPFNVNPCAWAEQVVIDPTNSNRLYVGMAINNCHVRGKSCGGLYRSADGGASFGSNAGCSATRDFTPNDYPSNDVAIVRMNPNRTNELYYGPGWVHPEEEAVATSYDYGDTIHFADVVDTRNSFLPAGEQYLASLAATHLELSPVNPEVRFAVHGDRFGITRRSDGVIDPVPNPSESSLWTIHMAPIIVRLTGDRSQSLVDGVGDNDADGEDTADNIWKPIFPLDTLPPSPTGYTTYTVDTLALSPNSANTLYISTHISPLADSDAATIWELTGTPDASQPWMYRKLYESVKSAADTTPMILTLKMDPSNPYRIYFVEEEKRTQTAGPPKLTRLEVLESTNQGATWSVSTLSSHYSYLHALEISEFESASGGRDIFLSSTQGLYRLDESGIQDAWAAKSFSFAAPQGLTFTTVVQDPRDRNVYFTKGPRSVSRSGDSGNQFLPIDEIHFGLGGGYPDFCTYNYPDPVLTTEVFNALAVDPAHAQTLFAGSDVGIWKNAKAAGWDWTVCEGEYGYSSVTQAWQHLPATGLSDTYVWSLMFDPGDPSGQTMWAGTRTGVFKSVDQGMTWTLALSNVRDARQIAISGDVFLVPTLDGLYRSKNHGRAWQRILSGAVNRVSERRGHAGFWLAATDNGLYRSTDAGVTWNAVATAFAGPVDTVLYTSSRTGVARAYYTGPGDAMYRTDVYEGPDTTPPSPPGGLAASSVTDSAVSLSWSAAMDNAGGTGVAGYYVSRGDAAAGPFTRLGDVRTAPTYTDQALRASTTYYYVVQAYDGAGNTSPYSAALGVTTNPDTTPPTAPFPVTATPLSPIKERLSWNPSTDNSGIAGYEMQYRKGTTPTWTLLPFNTETFYDLTPLEPGTFYVFTIRARDVVGLVSTWMTKFFQTPTLASDTTPPVISALQAASITTTGATISWTTNEDSNSRVEYGTTAAYGASSTLDGAWVQSHSVTLTGLSPGTLYHYRAISADVSGNTTASVDATFTTQSP